MGLDASVSIQAKNSLEKMLAHHQLAALHQAIMDHLAFSYQQGLLTFRKLRQGGHQRISV
jgi:hypothetical protein